MENQIISGAGFVAWGVALVFCAGITVFSAILLGAIRLEGAKSKGTAVDPRIFDWTIYLIMAIFAGFGATMLLFLDMPVSV